jgi:hypothetical protein
MQPSGRAVRAHKTNANAVLVDKIPDHTRQQQPETLPLPLVPAAIESLSYIPLPLPHAENPKLVEVPLEDTARPEVSAQSDTSHNTPKRQGRGRG